MVHIISSDFKSFLSDFEVISQISPEVEEEVLRLVAKGWLRDPSSSCFSREVPLTRRRPPGMPCLERPRTGSR